MSLSLDDGQRRELWGLALLALALLLALSFVPVDRLGGAAAGLFPTGNVVGLLGVLIRDAGWMALGAAALGVPLLLALWGVEAFGKLERRTAARLSLLVAGLMLIVPVAVALTAARDAVAPPAAGWLGATLGGALAAALGWAGASLLLLFAFAALCVASTGWNPLRSMARGGRASAGLAAGAAAGAMAGLRDGAARFPALVTRSGGVAAEDAASDDEDDYAEEVAALWETGDDEGGVDDDATVEAPARRRTKRTRGSSAPSPDPLPDDSGDPTSEDVPATALLDPAPPRDEARSRRELSELGQVLVDKLATFKIQGEVVGMTAGPVVTQFEVEPAPGVKVARIANLDADLALAMRAPSIRIVAPIPGKGAVGVEVPNPQPEIVFFRDVLESREFRVSRARLPLALGKDISGKPYVADLSKMPHLLIAGATGSGKSVCINTIITSLVYRHTPRTLRLLMVDPKMVELSIYNDLPHLRHPVVTDNSEAASVLKWAVLEMERRYALLSANGVRNLDDFNRRAEDESQTLRSPEPQGEEGDPDRWIYRGGTLPFVVVVIDELADLMMTVQGEVEKPLALLAQKARAIGIHLILATQRPSVNVITGLIKANFPSRIAFRVSSKVDSRTIIDQNGADNLLGNGDMLLLPPTSSEPVRLQGAYLSTEETERLMEWYRERARLRREEALARGEDPDDEDAGDEEDILDVVRAHEGADDGLADDAAPEDRDKLFRAAAELCIQQGGGSTSLLQRRMRIGYGRAARIIDQLHLAGILGPPDGSKPRDVLVDMVGLDQFFPED